MFTTTLPAGAVSLASQDPLTTVLKWVLLAVALICFALGWTTRLTNPGAPPYSESIVGRRRRRAHACARHWQWMRMPGDVVLAAGALLMSLGFIAKLGPLLAGVRTATALTAAGDLVGAVSLAQ
jgi:hypothetical protein